ncbi:MAG: hypothetical protein QNK23_09990 [Crocinitomicaceae bacterium]|nr:hypothetical protein [Crocinitomicaceae bacterium]
MTREEALLYLPISGIEELDDVYDEILHEFRTFFISKVPTTSLFSSKIERLNKMHLAYEVLAEEKIEAEFHEVELLSFATDNLFDLVIAYQQNQSNLKREVMLSESVLELKIIAKQLIENMKLYALGWEDVSYDKNTEVKVSQSIDEVELLVELERLHKEERAVLSEVPKLNSDSYVYKEAIRLSLWRKLERHV